MSAEVPDWLMLNGRRRMLHSYPLETYLRELPIRPDFRLNGIEYRRGYVADWEIRGDHTLWLTGLQTRAENDGPDPGLRAVFPQANGPVSATWVHQILRCRGNPRFNPMGYSTVFATELRLCVWAGRLIYVEEIQAGSEDRVGLQFTPQLEEIFGSEEAAFLRAIAAAPGDSAPRLIYADWLDEREDPRASLVRLNERIGAISKTGPIPLEGPDQPVDLRTALWMQLLGYDPIEAALRPR